MLVFVISNPICTWREKSPTVSETENFISYHIRLFSSRPTPLSSVLSVSNTVDKIKKRTDLLSSFGKMLRQDLLHWRSENTNNAPSPLPVVTLWRRVILLSEDIRVIDEAWPRTPAKNKIAASGRAMLVQRRKTLAQHWAPAGRHFYFRGDWLLVHTLAGSLGVVPELAGDICREHRQVGWISATGIITLMDKLWPDKNVHGNMWSNKVLVYQMRVAKMRKSFAFFGCHRSLLGYCINAYLLCPLSSSVGV